MRIKALFGILFCTIILFLCAFISSASASTLYVPDDYTTIQAAVDAAKAGDTIIVREGIYTENVNINKKLKLKGINYPIVKGVNTDAVFTIDGAGSVGSVIDGFNITNGAEGISLKRCTNSTIINNNCSYNKEEGIEISFGNNNIIKNNNCFNNYVGIKLYGSSNNDIANNNFSYNEIGICLQAQGGNYNTIINNKCCYNKEWGIYISTSDNILINNDISNTKCGLYLVDCSNNLFYLNNFVNIGQSMLYGNNLWNSTKKMKYTYRGKIYKNCLGNYWSDYEGSDVNGDGIGDSPYTYSFGATDAYPLMERFENYFTEITPTPIVTPTPTPTSSSTSAPTSTPTEVPKEEEKGIPGCEAVFAIVGLLAVSYILRRKTK